MISATVQARLQRWGGIRIRGAAPAAAACATIADDGYGDYLFAVSRLTPLKRFDLVLRALAEPVAAGIRCVIAGEGGELDALLRLRRQLDLDDRVEFVGRIDDAGAARAPRALPRRGVSAVQRGLRLRDRRSVLQSAKPVITCRDSGGPAELVRDGVNGFVTDPTPEALARAMRLVMDDRNLAIRLGEAGAADAARMTWPEAVKKLIL